MRFLIAALSLLLAAPAWAQTPAPVAALKAAKDVKAKVEAAQRGANQPGAQPPAAQPPAAAPAQPSAAPAAPATPPPADAQGNGYTYNPDGRRDPFVSLLVRGDDMRPSGGRPAGLAGQLIGEITVKGVLKDKSGYVAIVQAADTKTYIVHSGDRVMDGSIKSITADGIVFLQDVNDPLSLVKQREVRKAIRSEAK